MHNRTAGWLFVAALAVGACGPAHAATHAPVAAGEIAEPSDPAASDPARSVTTATGTTSPGAASWALDAGVVAAVESAARVDPLVHDVGSAVAPRCDACPGVQPDPPTPVVTHAAGAPARVVSSVKTTDPVVFITIDDGEHWNEDAALLLERARVPVTLFLTEKFVVDKYPQMRRLTAAGAWVEAHTVTHPNLARTAARETEVCSPLATFTAEFGRRGTLFRPPYGNVGGSAAVASTCGIHGVILWRASMNYGALAVQNGELHAGDIVLMHFRPDLADNLTELFRIVNEKGLRIGRLECYVGGDERCGRPWR